MQNPASRESRIPPFHPADIWINDSRSMPVGTAWQWFPCSGFRMKASSSPHAASRQPDGYHICQSTDFPPIRFVRKKRADNSNISAQRYGTDLISPRFQAAYGENATVMRKKKPRTAFHFLFSCSWNNEYIRNFIAYLPYIWIHIHWKLFFSVPPGVFSRRE